MDKLNIGVMGCADIANRSVIPAIIENPYFNLVATSSRSRKKADEFASRFDCESVEGYDSLIERSDVQVIYMPLPTGLHEEWVIKALESGKHILVEKSLALNYPSAKKMVDYARERNLLIMENFMFLYHGQHAFVKSLISNNEIGGIRCFRSSFGFPPLDETNFRYSYELGGGALLDAGAYTIRASQLVLGNKLEVEGAFLSNNSAKVDIFGGAFLKSDSNLFSQVAFGFDNFYQCNYEVWGSKGKITAHRAFTPGPKFEPLVTLEKDGKYNEYNVPAENHFLNLLSEFKRCIDQMDFENKYLEIINQARLLQDLRDVANENKHGGL